MSALVFDCDGVLADTERFGHLPAFNQTFEEFGLPARWSEEEYGRRLEIGGGKERMASLLTDDFVREAGLPADPDGQRVQVAAWHQRKTAIYKAMVAEGRLPARPGVARVIASAWTRAGRWRSPRPRPRIGPGGGRARRGPDLAAKVAVYAGDVVPAKKPDPAIYRLLVEDSAGSRRHTGGLRTPATACWPPSGPGCAAS